MAPELALRQSRAPWAIQLLVPAVVGGLTGIFVGIATGLIEDWLLEDVVLGLPGLWFAVPALFVFVLTRFALVKIAGTNKPGTAELYPLYWHDSEMPYPLRQVPGRILSGATTVGLGGSQGLESQSVLIGDSLAMLGKRLFRGPLSYLGTPDGRRLLLVSGAAAGISTVFSSPILGAVYGIEMPFRNRLDWPRLIPSLIASAASFGTASLMHRSRSLLTYVPHEIGAKEMLGVLVVAVICGLGARYWAFTMQRIRSWKDGSLPWLRACAAGVALAALAIAAFSITGTAVTAGPGYVASGWAIPANGPSPTALLLLAALILRALSVLLCVAAGGGGGVFTSMATNGLLIGTAVAVTLDLPNVTMLALAGAGAFLGAGYRLPLASAGLVVEISGQALPAALSLAAIGVAMVLVGNQSASDSQTDIVDPENVRMGPD